MMVTYLITLMIVKLNTMSSESFEDKANFFPGTPQ